MGVPMHLLTHPTMHNKMVNLGVLVAAVLDIVRVLPMPAARVCQVKEHQVARAEFRPLLHLYSLMPAVREVVVA